MRRWRPGRAGRPPQVAAARQALASALAGPHSSSIEAAMARKASGFESSLPPSPPRPSAGPGVPPVSADSGRRPAELRAAAADTGVRASRAAAAAALWPGCGFSGVAAADSRPAREQAQGGCKGEGVSTRAEVAAPSPVQLVGQHSSWPCSSHRQRSRRGCRGVRCPPRAPPAPRRTRSARRAPAAAAARRPAAAPAACPAAGGKGEDGRESASMGARSRNPVARQPGLRSLSAALPCGSTAAPA